MPDSPLGGAGSLADSQCLVCRVLCLPTFGEKLLADSRTLVKLVVKLIIIFINLLFLFFITFCNPAITAAVND